jgi:hypothetical protein
MTLSPVARERPVLGSCGWRRCMAVTFVAMSVAVSGGATEEPLLPAEGTRVRLTAPSIAQGGLVGALLDVDKMTLTLDLGYGKGTRQIPREAITGVEVSRQRGRMHRGAFIGALVGLGAGIALGIARGSDCGPDEYGYLPDTPCFDKRAAVVTASMVTVPVGVMTGLLVAPREKWERLGAASWQVSVAPARRGVRAVVRVGF